MKKLHPLCKLFPPASEEDFEAIKKSIKEFGFDRGNPIVTYQGYVLDGANRQRACEELGIQPHFDAFMGKDLVGFVFSRNFARRQLNAAQRAMIAAQFAKLKEGEHDIKGVGVGEKFQNLACKFEVSRNSLHIARRILGLSEDLAEEVKSGKVSLQTAAGLVELPKEELDAALKGKEALKEAVKKVRTKKPKSEVKFTPDPSYVPPEPSKPETVSAPPVVVATPPAASQTPKKAVSVEQVTKRMHDPFAPADRLPGFAAWFRIWWEKKTSPYGAEEAPSRGAKEVFDVVDRKLKEEGL